MLTTVILMLMCSTEAHRSPSSEQKEVRLVDGESRCSGRPEVLYQGEWRSVCSYFDFTAAMMVCRELGCGNAVSVNNGSQYKLKNLAEQGVVIQCEAKGSTTAWCTYSSPPNCFVNLGVICSGSVRLVDGAGFCSGRLEVKTTLSWTTVRENDFDWQDAEVVCRELGCGAPVTFHGMLFGDGERRFGTKEFQCNGTENRLLDCRASAKKEDVRTNGDAVRLTCSGPDDVRLMNGNSRCAGTVVMFHGGEWRLLRPVYLPTENNVTFHLFMKQAAVVCRQLGCGSAVSATWRKTQIEEHKLGVVSICEGSESALRECEILYEELNFISDVTCSDAVRLVDGVGFCSGRVEVKTPLDPWTTVFETDFDWQDAEVVCREVGCGPPLTLQGSLYGEGEHPVETKKFQCSGTEKALLDCSTSAKRERPRGYGDAVGLTCSEAEDVRLVGEGSRCAGSAEMFRGGEWTKLRSYPRTHAVEANSWSMTEAAVVCRQLGCGSAVAATWNDRSVPGMHVNCAGTESALRECSLFLDIYRGGHGGVICSGFFAQPSISFSTPVRPPRGHQSLQVFRGHSFTITCSSVPQYPGGSFYLRLPGTNRTLSQEAVNHSAAFFFHTAEDSHQGSYSCVYENQVTFKGGRFWVENGELSKLFIHNFSSKSEPFLLAVTDSPLTTAITRILVLSFLMLLTCSVIYMTFQRCGHLFIHSSSGHKRPTSVVLYENPETVFLQISAGDQPNTE